LIAFFFYKGIFFDEVYQRHHYEKPFQPKHVSIAEHGNKPIGALSVMVRRKDIFFPVVLKRE